MTSKNALTRWSGAIYLVLILSGLFSLAYVPMTLIDWSSPAATVSSLRDAELIFRLAIVSGMVCFLAFGGLSIVLYYLFESVDKRLALLLVVLVLVSVPITFVTYSHWFEVLTLLGDHSYLQGLPKETKDAQLMLALAAFNNGNAIGGIFWGLWLLPFGLLVYKSEFLPKTLGVLLVLGCFGYLLEFTLKFVFQVEQVPFYLSLPGTLGEFGICLWMLIIGSRSSEFEKV